MSIDFDLMAPDPDEDKKVEVTVTTTFKINIEVPRKFDRDMVEEFVKEYLNDYDREDEEIIEIEV